MQRNRDLNNIEAIDAATVHKICSGQVVLTLAIAVKELVENAIDASATNIEVRLKEYGSELVEVSDNGTGVRSQHFQTLTLKHYTSKLREFTDLETVETLGFRGEALSSLCALSELGVVTRHATAEHATRIKYDVNGSITESVPAAREIGTTVTLTNLFASLPVRRKEFVKNLKREYSKMCHLMQAYCLVSKGIKITCTNVVNGSKTTAISTEGANTVWDNIVNVFGPKQTCSLIQLKHAEPNPQVYDEYKVPLSEAVSFTLDCFISNASHGSGRSSTDRQFFYINSRPCEPLKLTKLINNVYKQFNPSQYPFVYLNVCIQRSLVDVNVTPDKRQVFVDNEKLLLAVLKCSLLETFKDSPSTYTLQNIAGVKRGLSGVDSFKKRFKQIDDCKVVVTDKPRALNDSYTCKTITLQSSLSYIKQALNERNANSIASESTCVEVNFHSQITPASNKAAENELQRQITKDKFKTMKVVGQFNLGFIIAQLDDDLFIIDQHATDEKYNFENLQVTTTLESQRLVSAKALELTAANEDLLMENEEVFKKNGFGFQIDRNAPATKKVSLTSIPISKNYIFGKNDIEEMLFMLQEGLNPAVCRPSRVQLMFATRACRKSVMIGCPLTKNDMRRLIDHMGEIDQPWNCPHGRPTMRHLINLKLLENK